MSARLILLCLALLFGAASSSHAQENGENASLHRFVEQYFTSWSTVDFATYRACFHPSATVHFDNEGAWRQWPLPEFLAAQETMQKSSRSREWARFTKIRARQGPLAFVEVFWELERGSGGANITGYDWFTLIRKNDSWQILSLAFWQEEAPGALLMPKRPASTQP